MIDICEILFSICEDSNVYNKDFDLIESGVLDSFALIELLYKLEEYGINIQPTRIDIKSLKTPRNIEQLINNIKEN